MATNNGPASGNAEILLGNTVYIEVQVPSGQPSLSPDFAPVLDATSSYSGSIVRTTTAAGVRFAIPA